jgi:uncharacterized surface protein with fasciclin (FAS1) repeats
MKGGLMRNASVVIFCVLLVPMFPALPANGSQKMTDDVVEVAIAAGDFTILVKALNEADLVEILRSEGPFTVFAPTDDAFGKLPSGTLQDLLKEENRDELVRILSYHVVPGRIDSVAALRAGDANTVQGQSLRIRLEEGRLRINEATVIANDIPASNGVIHVIDSVLLPPKLKLPDPRVAVPRLLESAINRGVPLFNNGQPVACGAVYEIAIQAVLDLSDDVSTRSRETLRNALAEGRGHQDPVKRAWILRRAMDFVLEDYASRSSEGPPAGSVVKSPSTAASSPSEIVLFSFDDEDPKWFSVNDDVMGGISKGGFSWDPSGFGIFSGTLSLENRGGFSTIRSPAQELGLGGYDGLLLRVKGDGRSYRVSAMTNDNRWEVNTWRTSFETMPGRWVEVRIPFADLVHTVMGRRVPGSGPLAAERIRSLSFMIADKNEKPFRLEVDWIKAYRDSLSQ